MKKHDEALTLECPVTYTLSILGGKWKWLIIYLLFEHNILRYGELKKRLLGITHKMLSQQLKELDAANLINRKEYQQIPPKVEYSLSEQGKTLLPILNLMCEWGRKNHPPV
ncbi:MAG: helix-turn-helix transcriptional regulator [Negativicutes bacterium]|jgi:DNA-binding HxlR family transcriptional regulator|nr:helix-turn-helix transcriptional regulator [Negativicutes bacterium]MBP8628561.1 helix-turn-helix transcriptional regulator [Negativicutes bacterium]MBP9537769.1 helix-turn-helix transcriptional regulator [Negativicutes bacterium]MBP9949754.1 helix-turn-helix transcriptional regulator [Negativicutes bacterium]